MCVLWPRRLSVWEQQTIRALLSDRPGFSLELSVLISTRNVQTTQSLAARNLANASEWTCVSVCVCARVRVHHRVRSRVHGQKDAIKDIYQHDPSKALLSRLTNYQQHGIRYIRSEAASVLLIHRTTDKLPRSSSAQEIVSGIQSKCNSFHWEPSNVLCGSQPLIEREVCTSLGCSPRVYLGCWLRSVWFMES